MTVADDNLEADYYRIYANINHQQRNKGLRANAPISPKGCRWRIWCISGMIEVVDFDNGLTAFEAHRKASGGWQLPHFSQCRFTQIVPYPFPIHAVLNLTLKQAARIGITVSYQINTENALVAPVIK